MPIVLSAKVLILVIVVGLVTAAYAVNVHNQSINNVYSQLNPQISVLRDQVSTRDAQIASLQAQIATLDSQLAGLQQQANASQQQITALQQQIAQLKAQIASIEAANIVGSFAIQGSTCMTTCSVYGAYANFGNQTARSIFLTLVWRYNGASAGQNSTTTLGDLPGPAITLFPTQTFSIVGGNGPVNQLLWSFKWST